MPLLHLREFTDATRLSAGGGAAAFDDGDAGDAAQAPSRVLSLAYASHPALRSLAACHALLFTALAAAPDLLQQRRMRNPCQGHLAAAQLHGIDAAWDILQHFNAEVQRVLALPLQHRSLLDEMRLAYLVTSDSPNAAMLVAAELAHGRAVPRDVVYTLLSVPCAPDALDVLLRSVVRRGTLNANDFQRCANALLSNDAFFSERTFGGMHGLLCGLVLPALRGDAFDFVSVRWTRLMNKWSRVYTKAGRGVDLQDCLATLLQAVPAAETKLPASFYVRLLGALLDAAVASSAGAAGAEGWARMTAVADAALRLFGRNPEDHHAVWVLLLKGALTVPPLRDDHQRLLAAYRLCARHGCPAAVDRNAFLQVVRLVGAAVAVLPHAEVARVVADLCTFMEQQKTLSFLWLLDGVGTVLAVLWQHHGVAAQGDAAELLRVLDALLRERRVSGVELSNNPAIARALDSFELAGAPAFWWTCGCGQALPCTSQRCTTCLRRSGVSWVCASCKAVHKTPCKGQPCECGAANPRLAAATAASAPLCNTCGLVADASGGCARCEQQERDSKRCVTCAHCGSEYGAGSLHCPQCFGANPDKAVYLWHCPGCDDFNYSIWSACRTCRAVRKTGALCLAFVPWQCGCGALNHPCRLACTTCGVGVHHHTYTCARCDAQVPLRALQRTVLAVDGADVSLHLCPHCRTPHPRDDLVLYSPSLARHCMRCAHAVDPAHIAATTGAVHHCGEVQRVNENYVFRCAHCQNGEELQTGFHCRHCLFPRPEVAALLREEPPITHVWRCLHETGDDGGVLCGQWNYSWCARCLACGTGRPDSPHECCAKALLWSCETCGTANRPIDVLVCSHCKAGLQPVEACTTCGQPHLAFACRVHL